jgi:nicotinamide-nucleotide amidase
MSEAEVVVLTGGLGPTEDDRTRAGLALAFGVALERDAQAEASLAARFRGRGRSVTEHHARQADRPAGSRGLDNLVGAAPGIVIERDGCWIVALPGVPAEMEAMFVAGVEPLLAARATGGVCRRTLKVAGRTESGVDQAVRDLYREPGLDVTILAAPTGIELHLRAEGAGGAEAAARLDAVEREMSRRLGADLFGRDDDTLPVVVGSMLRARGLTLATAESCTGGLLGGAITDVPGASEWYRGGFVTYANALKVELAGVPPATLQAFGAVSAESASALAHGARARCGADLGVGVTGIAGPDGGTPDKPVGLVHLVVADAAGERASRLDVPGGRRLVRVRAVTAALDLVRRRLTETA